MVYRYDYDKYNDEYNGRYIEPRSKVQISQDRWLVAGQGVKISDDGQFIHISTIPGATGYPGPMGARGEMGLPGKDGERGKAGSTAICFASVFVVLVMLVISHFG